MTINQAKIKALDIFNKLDKISEDDWISLSENWDMNIFNFGSEVGYSIYPVIFGQIQIQEVFSYRRNL